MNQDVRMIYQRHKKHLLFFGGLIIILLFAIFSTTGSVRQTSVQPAPSTPHNQPQPTTIQKQSKVLDIPKVYFASYSLNTTYPTVPESITTYSLKTIFTFDEIRTFAQKVGMNDIKESKIDYITLSSLADKNKGFGLLNKNSGSFNLQMYGDQRPNGYITGMSPQQEALVYLKELGISDESITCPITYQRKPFIGTNGYTYVECHRDWQTLDLPVYSLIGLLNTPANIPLNSLIVGKVRDDSPLDETVINVSTGQDGYARPNDFNTATIGIQSDGYIESIVSSFKWIQSTQTVTKNDILTPQEALDLFKSHKALLSLTIPDGTGAFNWDKVYQNNEANADQATVTDMTLSYLERPLSEAQNSFVPMYVIRGYALLKTGYTVRFVEVLPAIRSHTSSLSSGSDIQAVAGEQTKLAQEHPALQLKTFSLPTTTPTPSPTPTLTSTPTPSPIPTTKPTPTSAPTTASMQSQINNATQGQMNPSDLISNEQLQTINGCIPSNRGNSLSFNVPGYGVLNIFYEGVVSHVFYLTSTELPTSDVTVVKDAFFKVVENQFMKNVAYHLVNDFRESVAHLKSRDDVKNLYLAINQKDGTLKTGETCNPNYESSGQNSAQYNAPFFNCPDISNIGTITKKFEGGRFNTISDNVADRILSAISNNTLTEEALMPDQFPQRTLQNISWLFILGYDFSSLTQSKSACYISGQSPTLFIYQATKEQVTIRLSENTSLTQPSSTSNTWSMIADHNGILEYGDKLKTPYLYYEYDGNKVRFTSETGGYLVKKVDILSWLRNEFSAQLALNAQEEKRLEQEVTNAMYDKELTEMVKVTLVKQEEIDTKLPLRISPQPDHLYRIHLVLKPVFTSEVVTAPKLKPLDRNGFTVVELGVRVER